MSFTPFSDPAIVLTSVAGDTINQPYNASNLQAPEGSLHSRLEPGSALSKLLDSAMANAAKEKTPEPETRQSTSPPKQRQSILVCPLQAKPNAYLIEFLLGLRTSPDVKRFDTSQLPDSLFWALKSSRQKAQDKDYRSHNNNHNNSGNGGGNGRKNRRGNNAPQTGVNAAQWERQPQGFVRNAELDRMLSDKIAQLLGEAPDEGVPEWDSGDAAGDANMDMGLTVEDFERWKQRMHQEDRRKHGGDDQPEIGTASVNEVDSFFSFAKPKEDARQRPTPDAKSSRFSSFFGEDSNTSPKPSSAKNEGLRFFMSLNDSLASLHQKQALKQPLQGNVYGQSGGPSALQNSGHQSTGTQNPPPGLQRMHLQISVDQTGQRPPALSQSPHPRGVSPALPNGMPQGLPHGLPNLPPGLSRSGPSSSTGNSSRQETSPAGIFPPSLPQGHPVMPPGIHPGMPPANDSFFLSLMNKQHDDKPSVAAPNQSSARAGSYGHGSQAKATGMATGQNTPKLATSNASLSNQGVPNQGMANPRMANPGMPTPGMPAPGMPTQGMPTQGMPTPGMPTPGMPTPGIPTQGMSNPGIPTQGMSNPGMPNQGMPNSGMLNGQGMPMRADFQGKQMPQQYYPYPPPGMLPPGMVPAGLGQMPMQGQVPGGKGQGPAHGMPYAPFYGFPPGAPQGYPQPRQVPPPQK